MIVATAWRQSAGFTRTDMFFDDAWAALPSHVHLFDALRMTVSTPGWTLLLREWIKAGSTATWWAQVPAFVAVVIAGFSFYGVARYFRVRPWPAALATILFVANPTSMTYATRVKPYTVEILLALLILALGENVRRSPKSHTVRWLMVGSITAFFISFSTASVMVGVWIAVVLWSWNDPSSRRHTLRAAGVTGAGILVVGIPFLLASPASLGDRWVRRGFMADYAGLHGFGHNLAAMFAGFAHGVTGISVGYNFLQNQVNSWDMAVSVASFFLVGVLVWCTARPSKWSSRGALVPVGASLLIAVGAAMADLLPWGDGRTDEVLYPAVFLALAFGCEWVATTFRARARERSVVIVAGAVFIAGVGVANLVGNVARYPELNLNGLYAELRPQLRAGDVIVIPSFLSFSWAEADLSPWRVDFATHGTWPQGFRVRQLPSIPVVILPESYASFDPQLAHLGEHFRRVWYIGYTLGVWNPYVVDREYAAGLPMASITHGQLTQEGWRDAGFAIIGLNCYAEPLMLSPTPTQGVR